MDVEPKYLNSEKVKYCRKCATFKSLDDYNKNRSAKDGLQHYCTPCHLEMKRIGQQARRAADPEAYAEGHRQYNRKHYRSQRLRDPIRVWASVAVRAARKRAKKRRVDAEIDLEFIISIAPIYCPVFGTELDYNCESGKKSDASPTIDCLDPSLGYIPSNVTIISEKANRGKSDATLEQLMQVFRYARS